MNKQPTKKQKSEIKFNHFDDAFKILLLIITITLSLGSFNSDKKFGLLSFYVFVISALVLWIIGHFFGTKPHHTNKEIFCKVLAWALAITGGFIASINFFYADQPILEEWIYVSMAIGSFSVIPLIIFFSEEVLQNKNVPLFGSIILILNVITIIFQNLFLF